MPPEPPDQNDDLSANAPLARAMVLRPEPEGRLLYVVAGSAVLEVASAAWPVMTGGAAWLPAGMSGLVQPCGAASLAVVSLNVSPEHPPGPVVTTSLLRALVARLTAGGSNARGTLRAALAEELARLPDAPEVTPAVTDARLRRLATKLLEPDGLRLTLATAGREVGMSARNFSRLVRRETQLSFVGWRQTLHVAAAIGQLAQGESVASVAYAVGYDSPSAFISMFKRVTSMTPSEYASLIRGSSPAQAVASPRGSR